MKPIHEFIREAYQRVPGYQRFLSESGIHDPSGLPIEKIPLQTKQNYLLKHPIEDLCWDGAIGDCHLIGSSSGFSKSGSVFWPKRPQDEKNYLNSIEKMLVANYQIDQKRTLIVCCMALGTWFGRMAITAAVRILATEGRLPITVCTPGLNLSEAVEIFSRFHRNYDQSLWFTNPSSIGLISTLMKKKGIEPAPASVFFPVVGEYFSEAFRETVAVKYGHEKDAPFVVWTGYGSADAGDLGVETADMIRLRR